MLSHFDPNCEYRPVEEVDAVCGHQALIGWTKRWLEAWSSYSDRIAEIIDGGEIVVAAVSITGRGRTSGVEIRQRYFHVFEMREGRILRLREYLDRDSALKAAGLSESRSGREAVLPPARATGSRTNPSAPQGTSLVVEVGYLQPLFSRRRVLV